MGIQSRLSVVFVITGLLALASPRSSSAAEGADAGGTVTGVGTAKVDSRPELLRVEFDICGEGAADPVVQLYVTRISPEERAKLMAEAYGKAKDEAARLARAAGTDLGKVQTLTSTAGSDPDGDGMSQYQDFYQQQRMMGMGM